MEFRRYFRDFEPLTRAEERLLADAQREGEIWCGEGKDRTDPEYEVSGCDKWGQERQIHAGLLRRLLSSKEAVERVTPTGLEIIGAVITGRLDISFIKLPFPLGVEHCLIQDGLNVSFAEIGSLSLIGSKVEGLAEKGKQGVVLNADFLTVNGDLLLWDLEPLGSVWLRGVSVRGSMDCRGLKLQKPREDEERSVALWAPGISVSGSVLIARNPVTERNTDINGQVSLISARIGGEALVYWRHAQQRKRKRSRRSGRAHRGVGSFGRRPVARTAKFYRRADHKGWSIAVSGPDRRAHSLPKLHTEDKRLEGGGPESRGRQS